MNERKTENIVRRHFQKFVDDNIIFEEQQSDIPKIDKLLKYASKRGGYQGYPEFIISFKDNQNFIIIVECKSDISKHISKSQRQYADYAVDGALLYASFLSKEFDVLAIAVSGQETSELKVSHYLQLKNNGKHVQIFGNKLLTIKNYIDGYLHSPEKFRQDYDGLLAFSRELNQKLHSNKILENQRSLLISSILIALENNAFRKSYKEHDKPEDLANSLVDTVVNELKRANIQPKKLDNLKV